MLHKGIMSRRFLKITVFFLLHKPLPNKKQITLPYSSTQGKYPIRYTTFVYTICV